jgi:muramoyltetrapeptide carboxypeptidase
LYFATQFSFTAMIQPVFLQPGATIGITCPSGYVDRARVANAAAILQQWGYRVVEGETVGNEFHYFSGDDATRLRDLQRMLDDPAIDAILMGRGGYGVSRIIDQLDFSRFMERPKWIAGFSDITVLHNHLHARYGVASLHSVMCGAFRPETAQEDYILSLKAALNGTLLAYDIPSSPFNRIGTAEGIVTGGNVAILAHLTGSVSEVDTDGKILFIEDVGEHLYNLDRMLLNLKRAGKFDRLKALLVGGFTDMQDTERPFGSTVEEIISEKVREYDYPVCFNFSCGHLERNMTLVLGTMHRLEVRANGASLVQL